MKALSPAAKAREAAGLTLTQAARRARVSPAYLRRMEAGGCSYGLALELAHLYHCPVDLFLARPRAERQPRVSANARESRNRQQGAVGEMRPGRRPDVGGLRHHGPAPGGRERERT